MKSDQPPVAYADGTESQVLEVLRATEDLSSSASIRQDLYGYFPFRYHLCPDRSVLLRPFDFSGLRVLELGAGMGGVSRYLAESAAHLTVVEGSPARMAACRERLRDLDNWTSCIANIQDFATDETYDVVLLIGVLEYADLYVDRGAFPTPFDAVLAKASSLLARDGVLFVAIENKLGLKYWAGASEDHSGQRFDGIAGYADRPVPRTFSRKEMGALLNVAGFGTVREYFPVNDYKLPNSVLSRAMLDDAPMVAGDLMGMNPGEDYAAARCTLFPDSLGFETVRDAGLLAEFANSFLFVSTRRSGSTILAHLTAAEAAGEIAWHYTISYRLDATLTVFHRPTVEGGVPEVSKRLLIADPSKGPEVRDAGIIWHAQARTPLKPQPLLLSALRRHAYYGEWPAFEAVLDRFLSWSFARWRTDDPAQLQGRAVDAGINNAVLEDGAFAHFDLEWELRETMARSWFILRNIVHLQTIRPGATHAFPYASLGDLYLALCRRHGLVPALEDDLRREAAFLQATCRIPDVGGCAAELRHVLINGLRPVDGPLEEAARQAKRTLDADLANARAEIAALHAAMAATSARLATRPFRMAARAADTIARHPRLVAPVRWLFRAADHPNTRRTVLALLSLALLLAAALYRFETFGAAAAQFAEMGSQARAPVDRAEFVRWSVRGGTDPAEAARIFAAIDANHDGIIEYDEWHAYVRRSLGGGRAQSGP